MSNDLDDIDYESIIHGLDPDKVFAMGEHCGAKAFKNEALALLEAEYERKISVDLLTSIEIIKNITV